MINRRNRSLRRQRLQLEPLETRRCMDATMEMIGDTLFVRGSMEADQIAIIDYGNGRISASNSAFAGGRPIDFSGVGNVLVRSKRGDDDVRYSMPDPSRGASDIVICMGPEGNNQFHFDAGPASAADTTEHRLTINGGADNDQVVLDFSQGASNWTIHSDLRGGDDQFAAKFVGNESAGPHVALKLRGGDGDDQFDLDFAQWLGESSIELDLGQGNDHVRTKLGFIDPQSRVGSSAPAGNSLIIPTARVNIVGGAGDDDVALDVLGAAAEIDVQADLGLGDDTLRTRVSLHAGSRSEIIPCVKVAVDAGEGRDHVSLDLRGYSGITDIDVDLGAGADHLFVLADPPPERFRARLAGGDGNDAIDVVFSALGRTRGEVQCLILGGAGDDQLSLDARGLGDSRLVKARIDGGPGVDRVRASTKVVVVNSEN